MGRRVYCDIEANGLLPTVTKIWCIVARDLDTRELFKFRPKSALSGHVDFMEDFNEFAATVDIWVGHNFLGYDVRVINKLLGTGIKVEQVVDTLVLSRLFRPVSPFGDQVIQTDNRIGGHSLESWGIRLGIHKIQFDDFSKFSEPQLEYCVQDTILGEAIYVYLMENEASGFSQQSIDIEHQVYNLLVQQELNGFYLDQEAAKRLETDTAKILKGMDDSFAELFPPEPKLVKRLILKKNKDGSTGTVPQRILNKYRTDPMLRAVKLDEDTYDLYRMEVFNPQSSTQIGERLLKLGWLPKKFTPTGKPKTDKETLFQAIEELSQFPEIKALSQYNIVADRNQKAIKWLTLVQSDGRVHGRINPIGAGTHRCSHYDDNMANIARVVPAKILLPSFIKQYGNPNQYERFQKLNDGKIFLKASDKEVEVILTGLEGKYGWESRSCWIAAPGKVLVGSDAAGIQLRALAHYMDDKDYTKALLEGDIHEVNRAAAGIANRNAAKTFIYAWLLGAGDEKIGTIVGVTPEEYDELWDWAGGTGPVKRIIGRLHHKGRKADQRTVYTIIKGAKIKRQFLEKTPSLKRLKEEDIPKAASDGFLVGLDGRKLWIPSEHLAMSLYLQGFEAVVMKYSNIMFDKEMASAGIEYKQVAFTHDEYEDEVVPEVANDVGKARVWSIERAGNDLGSKCPLTGEYRIGRTWGEVH